MTRENFQMTYMSFENLTKQITVKFGLSSNHITLFHPFPQVGYHLNPFFPHEWISSDRRRYRKSTLSCRFAAKKWLRIFKWHICHLLHTVIWELITIQYEGCVANFLWAVANFYGHNPITCFGQMIYMSFEFSGVKGLNIK